MNLLSLAGKTVVVTGGARGLGLTFAWGAAEVGANIAALDRLDNPHDDYYLLEKKLGAKTKLYKLDVTSYESLENVFGQVKKDFGTIDHCITAAGIPTDKPFFEHTPADMRALMSVNVEGSFFTAQIAAKHMVDQGTGGSIVMIASIAAHASVPGKTLSGYCFSKGAILSGARALAIELAEHNIRVNTISPGFILTDMTVQNIAKRPNILNEIPQYVPMKRLGDRGDLKTAMVMLLSDASAYTTGSDLLIDGGLIAS